jgi:acyl-CoA thioester hydrolase
MQTVECKIKVRYSETGKMGFAHHANYFNWFDIAQEELLSQQGQSYNQIEALGYRFVPVHTSCDFKTPAYYDDCLTVRIRVKTVRGIRMSFGYEIVREKDTALIAVGESEHLLLDKNMKVAMIKTALPEIYAFLSAE